MVKKAQKSEDKKKAALLDSQLTATIRESAQQIWLAGLGAFSKAQAEGGKVFEALVKEGAGLQKKSQAVAEERFAEVAGKMSTMASEAGARAGQRWDKLESMFEEGVAKALGRMGMPSSKDIDSLRAQVEALKAQVESLSKIRPPRTASAKAPAGRSAPRRPATKRTPGDKAGGV